MQSRSHDFERFLKGLRPAILKNMKECKTMHDTYWEAHCTKHLLKWYHRMRQATAQEGKSLESTKANVMEPIAENINADVEKRKHETNDSTINSDEVTDKTPTNDSTSDE